MDDDDVVVLTDMDGNEIKCEFLDLIPYQSKEYVVLLPLPPIHKHIPILDLEEERTG